MSLFGSLEVGKKSLSAAQLGQGTAGHNIANVDTEGFSRQEIVQNAAKPTSNGKGQGTVVSGIRRIHDAFTKDKVLEEQMKVGTWETKEHVLTEAEVIFTDLEGQRLRGSLNEFWGAWNSVANEPESVPLRKALVAKSEKMTERFGTFYNRLSEFQETLNKKINNEIKSINQLTRSIAEVNKQVQQLETRNVPANDARDKREQLLQELSAKIEIRYFEGPRGTLEVQIPNGQNLVYGRDNYNLSGIIMPEDKGNVRIGLTNANGLVHDISDEIHNGSLKEFLSQRDVNIKNYMENLDKMVNEVAFRVNQLHSRGTGINSIRQYEKSAYRMDQKSSVYPLPDLKSGFFSILLVDQDKEIEEEIFVEVEAGVDSVQTIIEKINNAADAYELNLDGEPKLKESTEFKAYMNKDGTVTFQSGRGKSFIYGGDETNVMAVLGLNCFFHTTEGAKDIRVNPDLVADEMKIVTGSKMVPSDNRIALEIAELQMRSTMNDETISFDEFYNSQITDIGLKVQDAQRGNESHTQMLEQYKALRDSVSSVNLDEEMANMVKYQRAYESSAKFLSTIDEMTQTMINI